MYGGYGRWLFGQVGGVGRAPGSRGWSSLLFTPPLQAGPASNVSSAAASITTPIGLASIDWASSSQAAATVAVAVPANAGAALVLPLPAGAGASASVAESLGPVWAAGKFVPGVPGVLGAALEGDSVIVRLGSGAFSFTIKAAG